jgi:uncharacterized protein with GYD domain
VVLVCIQQLLVCEPSRRALGKPHFVNLIRYTQQGIAKIKESPARLEAAKRYLTMGQYDAVIISEFPSCPERQGELRIVTTETLRTFTEGEYRNIVGALS